MEESDLCLKFIVATTWRLGGATWETGRAIRNHWTLVQVRENCTERDKIRQMNDVGYIRKQEKWQNSLIGGCKKIGFLTWAKVEGGTI